jgi:hypothetical protein
MMRRTLCCTGSLLVKRPASSGVACSTRQVQDRHSAGIVSCIGCTVASFQSCSLVVLDADGFAMLCLKNVGLHSSIHMPRQHCHPPTIQAMIPDDVNPQSNYINTVSRSYR